jgi:hypothetical protein
MNEQELLKGVNVLAEETGIPVNRLLEMRGSELEPLFQLVFWKLRLRMHPGPAVRARVEAELSEWLEMHPECRAFVEPQWRAYQEAKRKRT